jgi:hypothetical protein
MKMAGAIRPFLFPIRETAGDVGRDNHGNIGG